MPNSTQANGTQLDIWTCGGGSNQIWTLTSGQLTVYSGSSQKCLDAFNNQTTPGTKVEIWTCNGGANQQWAVNSNGTITGTQSGLCLDVTGASTANGALADGLAFTDDAPGSPQIAALSGTAFNNSTTVSPTNDGSTGYPLWYRDANGVRVEPCLSEIEKLFRKRASRLAPARSGPSRSSSSWPPRRSHPRTRWRPFAARWRSGSRRSRPTWE